MKNTIITIALLFLTGCTSLPTNPLTQTNYEATRHVDLSTVLPLPPSLHSIADEKDMAAVLMAQRMRTPKQIVLAQLDADISIFSFQSVLGDQFNPQKLPITKAFFDKVIKDEKDVIHLVKDVYHRPRPYVSNPHITTVVPRPGNRSYPSGHACFAYVTAIILAQMVPEKADAIFDRASQYAQNRVIAGVHYPTDIEAGKMSAAVIMHELFQDAEFRADFEKAKSELRHTIQP